MGEAKENKLKIRIDEMCSSRTMLTFSITLSIMAVLNYTKYIAAIIQPDASWESSASLIIDLPTIALAILCWKLYTDAKTDKSTGLTFKMIDWCLIATLILELASMAMTIIIDWTDGFSKYLAEDSEATATDMLISELFTMAVFAILWICMTIGLRRTTQTARLITDGTLGLEWTAGIPTIVVLIIFCVLSVASQMSTTDLTIIEFLDTIAIVIVEITAVVILCHIRAGKNRS